MPRRCKVFVLAMLTFLIVGCASDGSFSNPFSTADAPAPGMGYYYSEFEDIPIPNELNEARSDTFITFAQSGIKCGTQRFTGRVEVVSLMNTMRRFMANNGWTLRSLLRAKESTLIFEKPDRIASFQIADGVMTTEMRVVVSSRLEGDSASVEMNAYAAPTYGNEQRLSQ